MDTDLHVEVTDVVLRDGLQSHPRTLPTDTKMKLLDRLLAAGVRSMEVGSFVSPKMVPTMADTEEIFRRLPSDTGTRLIALVPNLRGAQRALDAGAKDVRLVLSATEGHSRSNTNRSVAEGLQETRQARDLLVDSGVDVTVALATSFVCPYDGVVPVEHLVGLVDKLVGMGFVEISLADTLGKADPAQIERALAAVRSAHPQIDVSLHLHNTYGMALANAVAGLNHGVRAFDAALGGIGGCPFAPGAAGNVATEDIVFMLHAMGYTTGLDLEALATAARDLRAALQSPLDSAVSRALGWVA